MSAIPSLPAETPLTNGHDTLPVTSATNLNGTIGPSTPFTLHDVPVENQRPLKVIVIGAGYSGIYLGIRIPERLRNIDLTIYEKNAGVGGTWWENRYLGCACDIPSHSYQYSFEPNPSWSSLYAPAKEIQAYLERVAKKYSADRFIKLSHKVERCVWDEEEGKWYVNVRDLATGEEIKDNCDVLICARGFLNEPSWPDIPGLRLPGGEGDFAGEVMHSAAWNEEYDFSSKRIAVLGTGSSSIQIVPSLQRLPSTHTTVYGRSKTWISPSFGQDLWDAQGFKGFDIPPSVREVFEKDPEAYHKFRLAVEEDGNSIHSVTIRGTKMQMGAKERFERHMRDKLKSRPEILDALLPSFSPGCRRLTPGPGYLEALTKDNVAFVTSPIVKVSENAVHTADGRAHQVDAIICATGFQTGAPPPFPVVGRNGMTLESKWAGRATSYLSHSVSGFPNLFLMLGPNAGIGSGSLTMMIESLGSYAVKFIRKLQKEDILTMTVRPSREQDFVEYIDSYFPGTVFGEECKSWYKNGEGKVTGLWPGSTLHCIEALMSPRWEDYLYRYVGEGVGEGDKEEDEEDAGQNDGVCATRRRKVNRLRWLGNGFSQNETEGKNLAWYLYPEFCERVTAPIPEENVRFQVRAFSH